MALNEDVAQAFDPSGPSFGTQELDHLSAAFGLEKVKVIRSKGLNRLFVLDFSPETDVTALVKAYGDLEMVRFAEPDYIGYAGGRPLPPPLNPNDTYFNLQWGLYNDGSFPNAPATPDADIDMELAWDIETGDASVVVAVLDAGARMTHPEFEGRLWQNSADPVNGIDDDANGFIDDFQGWDFAGEDNNPTDGNGHGTNVAGVIGAKADNGLGFAGVDWHCKLLIGRIINNDGWGYFSWWAEGLYYAADMGADVINMSVGGEAVSQALEGAVNYAYNNGCTIVACMMNFDNGIPQYPAAYDATIAVGATDPDDTRSSPFFWSPSSGSSFGNHIDVVAPGNYSYGLSAFSDDDYSTYWGGTSQAAPLVSGLAALLLAQDPSRSPEDLRQIIRATAEDQVGWPGEDAPGWDMYYGAGRINAFAALSGEAVGTESLSAHMATTQLWPNPSGGTFWLSFGASLSGEPGRTSVAAVSIHDLKGNRVFAAAGGNSEILNLSPGLAPGMYVLSAVLGDGTSVRHKLIIE